MKNISLPLCIISMFDLLDPADRGTAYSAVFQYIRSCVMPTGEFTPGVRVALRYAEEKLERRLRRRKAALTATQPTPGQPQDTPGNPPQARPTHQQPTGKQPAQQPVPQSVPYMPQTAMPMNITPVKTVVIPEDRNRQNTGENNGGENRKKDGWAMIRPDGSYMEFDGPDAYQKAVAQTYKEAEQQREQIRRLIETSGISPSVQAYVNHYHPKKPQRDTWAENFLKPRPRPLSFFDDDPVPEPQDNDTEPYSFFTKEAIEEYNATGKLKYLFPEDDPEYKRDNGDNNGDSDGPRRPTTLRAMHRALRKQARKRLKRIARKQRA